MRFACCLRGCLWTGLSPWLGSEGHGIAHEVSFEAKDIAKLSSLQVLMDDRIVKAI